MGALEITPIMKLVAALLLLSGMALASAARLPGVDDAQAFIEDLTGLQHWVKGHSGVSHPNLERGQKGAYVTTSYYCPPDRAADFERAFHKLEQAVREDDEDNIIFDLKKVVSDNILYYSYGEWKGEEGIKRHAMSEPVLEFLKTIGELDVVWKLQPLLKAAEDIRPKKRTKTSHDMAHVLIKYVVPASDIKFFIDEWETARDAVEDSEEGARIYSLRKALTDNVSFWAYGTWDSMQDYKEHFESEHIKRLRSRLAERRIVWSLSILHKIGDEPEK